MTTCAGAVKPAGANESSDQPRKPDSLNFLVETVETERGRSAKLADENSKWAEHHDWVVGRRNKTISEERAEKENLRIQNEAKDAQIRILQLLQAVEYSQKRGNGAVVNFLLDAQAGRETKHGTAVEAYDGTYAASLRACKLTAAHFEELKALGHDYRPPKATDWDVEPTAHNGPTP